ANPDASARGAIESALAEQWIRLAPVPPSGLLTILLSSLHRGEAEAIALAVERRAGIVLIDEQEGRQTATRAGLAVTGVLGVLLRAKSRGEISALKPEMTALCDKARFFIAPALESRVLSLAGE
ncbi:MAG TPA: DUF3368 domain-containing protein, partial [Bryobacteraceae bacterium]|nr:DUF3368 domain-containing protein [Bryobacteraceae bacterium]